MVLFWPILAPKYEVPCDFGLKKLKIDFVDILNVLLHLSKYKLECPGKNTLGTKTHIVNTFEFDLCVYIHV
jgi:hypothetical protein